MAIFPDLGNKSQADNVFNQLINRPYIRPIRPFQYEILELLRTVLGYSIRIQSPDLWQEYHARARNFFNGRQKKDPTNWYYHNLAYYLANDDQEVSGIHYWEATLNVLQEQGADAVKPLLDAARDTTLIFTFLAIAVKEYLNAS